MCIDVMEYLRPCVLIGVHADVCDWGVEETDDVGSGGLRRCRWGGFHGVRVFAWVGVVGCVVGCWSRARGGVVCKGGVCCSVRRLWFSCVR